MILKDKLDKKLIEVKRNVHTPLIVWVKYIAYNPILSWKTK